MALVTGTLTDFNLASLSDLNVRMVFTPSGTGLVGTKIFAPRPISVVPNSAGAFAVELVPTVNLTPACWYELRIEWAEPGGGYSAADFPDFKLSVPLEGGIISELVNTPITNAYMVAWQPNEPDPWPVGLTWANTASGDIIRRDA